MERTRHSFAEADRPLAARIGRRLRHERLRAGLTQAQLAEGRYTKSYVSALENGLVKPSMAALSFIAGRLDIPITRLVSDDDRTWARLEADIRLASGDWQAAADRYQELVDTAVDRSSRPDLLTGLAEALYRLDRGRDGIAPASEAASLFRTAGRNADAARAVYWQAACLYQQEASDEARALFGDLHRQVREGLAVLPDFEVRLLIALAMVESRDDRPEQALGYLESARTSVAKLDDRRRATFLFSLAISYRELGDMEGALTTGNQSLVLFRSSQAAFEVASIENELALVHLELGNLSRAKACADDAAERFETLDDRRWLAHVVDTQAQVLLASGDRDRAREAAGRSVALARETDNHKALVSALLTLARSKRALGDLEGAWQTLDEAAATARRTERRQQLRDVLTEWSEVAAERGDVRRAFELSHEALLLGRARPRQHTSSVSAQVVERTLSDLPDAAEAKPV